MEISKAKHLSDPRTTPFTLHAVDNFFYTTAMPMSILLLLVASQIHFLDIAEKAGLDFQLVSGSVEKEYILETMGAGVAWINYNRDGWPDLTRQGKLVYFRETS
jgi:hypothetical protein